MLLLILTILIAVIAHNMLLHAFYPTTRKTFHTQQFFLFHKMLKLGTFVGTVLAGDGSCKTETVPGNHGRLSTLCKTSLLLARCQLACPMLNTYIQDGLLCFLKTLIKKKTLYLHHDTRNPLHVPKMFVVKYYLFAHPPVSNKTQLSFERCENKNWS